jgi:hypothetical protein
MAPRKCLFLYHYPVFGFLSVRLQTWFPFPVHIYLNGREWLARKMDQAGIGYRRHDNCFTWIENVERAQTLMNEQLKTNWVQCFDPLLQQVHPLLFADQPLEELWRRGILPRERGPLSPWIICPRMRSAGTSGVARESGGDSMAVEEASALENTLARIRERYALYFYLPDGVKPGDERAIEVELSDAARKRYPGAEVRSVAAIWRRIAPTRQGRKFERWSACRRRTRVRFSAI